jgi:putative Ca2+/H+ antiporter (TMEM165/GDT1 family)/putative Mn2+ efflux pump MntP
MESLFVSAFVVALAEIGDKTQLLAIVLATRFRKPLPIIAGILVATLANHALAALAGFFLTDFLSGAWFKYALALSFIAMAIWALVPDKIDEMKEHRAGAGIFITTLVAFFIVEIGDKTQVATAALAARFHEVMLVTAGTTLGMMLANVPAVFLGEAATKVVPLKYVRLGAALIFFALGLWALAEAADVVEELAAWSMSTSGAVALSLAAMLSMNALSYGLRSGENLRRPSQEALMLGSTLGLFKFLVPWSGWAIGFTVSNLLRPIDHWIAFSLLGAVGVYTIVMSLRRHSQSELPQGDSAQAFVFHAALLSFDAFIVGIILGLLNAEIAGTAIAAGVMCFAVATLGALVARYAPRNRRNYPEILGGIFLVMTGGIILYTHLHGI